MSRSGIEQSLDAVEEALTHFAASLEHAGFSAGADSYRKMSEVVLGHWLWVEGTEQRDLEPRYLRIAELADAVAGQLAPYVDAMRRLSALRGLVEDRWGVDSDSTAGRIIGTLAAAPGPLSVAEVRDATGVASSVARRALDELVEDGKVTRVGERRPRYELAA